jgi:ketosteroid isomerase-like protein
MSVPASPQDVVESLMRGISDGQWSELDQLFAEDAVIDYPFALPAPVRLDGIGAIRRYFATTATFPMKLRARNLVVHTTADPDVVIAEWDYDGVATSTGRVFRVSNITVSTIREGKIVASRDYHNHAVLADVIGRTS